MSNVGDCVRVLCVHISKVSRSYNNHYVQLCCTHQEQGVLYESQNKLIRGNIKGRVNILIRCNKNSSTVLISLSPHCKRVLGSNQPGSIGTVVE